MNLSSILDQTVASLEKMHADANARIDLKDLRYVVVSKKLGFDGLFFVYGNLYADQIPPEGTLVGFRAQRLADLEGVFTFGSVEAHKLADELNGVAVQYPFWLANETAAILKCLNVFKSLRARVVSKPL